MRIEGSEKGFFFGCCNDNGVRDLKALDSYGVIQELTTVGWPVVSERRRSLCCTTRSASARFQKHAKPVPRERPVAPSMVIRAYRKGPKARNLRENKMRNMHRVWRKHYTQSPKLILGGVEGDIADE